MEEVIICRTRENDERFEFRASLLDNTDRTVHDVSLSHEDYETFGLRGYATTTVAHLDDDYEDVLTWKEFNEATDELGKSLVDYTFLLTGASRTQVEPVIEAPWQSAFTVAWLPNGVVADGVPLTQGREEAPKYLLQLEVSLRGAGVECVFDGSAAYVFSRLDYGNLDFGEQCFGDHGIPFKRETPERRNPLWVAITPAHGAAGIRLSPYIVFNVCAGGGIPR